MEEKTEFDVRLTKFDEKAKIKVIKEIRNLMPDLKLAEVRGGLHHRCSKAAVSGPKIKRSSPPSRAASPIFSFF